MFVFLSNPGYWTKLLWVLNSLLEAQSGNTNNVLWIGFAKSCLVAIAILSKILCLHKINEKSWPGTFQNSELKKKNQFWLKTINWTYLISKLHTQYEIHLFSCIVIYLKLRLEKHIIETYNINSKFIELFSTLFHHMYVRSRYVYIGRWLLVKLFVRSWFIKIEKDKRKMEGRIEKYHQKNQSQQETYC